MWDPSRSNVENCFLWQIIHHTPATQHWRFPELPPSDPATWCTRCDLNLQEDILHCIWYCPLSRQVWQWAQFKLHIAAGESAPPPTLQPQHIFVAHPLPPESLIPNLLWSIIRPIIVWNIWKNRCTHFIDNKPASAIGIISKSWHRLGVYIKRHWSKLHAKHRAGRLSLVEAEQKMQRKFGASHQIWNLHEVKIQVPPVPPRPP